MHKPVMLTWAEVCADPSLNDLPYKIELNRFNQLVMSPASARHSRLQGKIIFLLGQLLKSGEAFPELALQTSDNVKAPDVVWAADATLKAHARESTWSSAPELCVEVLSPSNTEEEIDLKRQLYFECGAKEVWVCDWDGAMTFYSPATKLKRSLLCPKFPTRVKV